MGNRRGRPPKPSALRVAEGMRGHRPLNADEPKPPDFSAECPAYLPKEARAVWDRLVPDLEAMGLAARVRADALACLCEAVADYAWALGELKRKGKIQNTEYGLKAHPAVKMRNDAAKRIKDFCIEFGITPSAAVRVVVKKRDEQVSPIAKFRMVDGA